MNEDGSSEAQLWIADLASGSTREIAVLGNPGKSLYPPAWSADGTLIAFMKYTFHDITAFCAQKKRFLREEYCGRQ